MEDPGNYSAVSLISETSKIMEVIHPQCTHRACEGQRGDQAQPAWVHERQVPLSNLISFYDQVTCLPDEGKTDGCHLPGL